ncbi:hypothetical protein OsccyDRAFT_0673 [Leptolyngbyaceae cyanobacterium JSC-12]|nr:hypothetical protein OsccyDRAFT_0673 [Leptolyngbyaceae cyanobacterium JSC-12]
MSIPEKLFVGSIVVGWAAELVNLSLSHFKYKKFLPYLHKIFVLIDPIIKSNLPHMSSNDVYSLVEKAAIAVADETLSPKEISELVSTVLKTFKVDLAANSNVVTQTDKPISTQIDEAIDRYKNSAKELFSS